MIFFATNIFDLMFKKPAKNSFSQKRLRQQSQVNKYDVQKNFLESIAI